MKSVTCMRQPFVLASAAKPIVKSSDVRTPNRLTASGKRAVVLLPGGLLLSAPAWAEDLVEAAKQSAESGRQALSASQVPQWSQVQVPEGLPQAPELGNVLGTSGVNPLLLLGAVAAIAVPAVLYQALNPGSKVKGSSPANVVAALTEEPRAQLVDIRSASAAKAAGSPDLRATKRRLLSIPYTRVTKDGSEEIVEGWAERAAKQLKPDSIVILIDEDGRTAAKAAAELDNDTFSDLYFVTGGANAWEKSGQAWKAASKGLDLSGLGQSIGQSLGTIRLKAGQLSSGGGGGGGGGGLDVGPTTVLAGAGAVLGALVLFNSTGGFLEVVGIGAAANWAYKNFFFADDRKRTTKKLQKLLNEDIAPAEAGKDIRRLTEVLLEGGSDVAAATEGRLESAAGDLKEKAKEVAGDVQGQAKKVAARVEGKADQVASQAKGKADQVAGQAKGKADQVAGQAKDKADQVGGQAKGKADQVAGEAKSAAASADKKTPDSVDEAANEAAKKAEQAKGEVRQWVDNWRNKSKTA